MRTSDRITFTQTATKRKYNPDTGEYEGGTAIEVVRPCLLQDLGLEKSMQVFGDYKKSRKVAILLQPYKQKCEKVSVNGSVYRVTLVKGNGKIWYLESDSVENDV